MTADGTPTIGVAVSNTRTGVITISGADTVITSANVTTTQGTVFIASSGTATAARLTMNGGTIRNTADNANARTVYNASTGAVNINGGTVEATGAVLPFGTQARARLRCKDHRR